jgi:RND family efflux transporter MFP subunit
MNRKVVTPLLIVLGGVGFAALLLATGPKVEPRARSVVEPLVRVLAVEPSDIQLRVSTHGTVVPRTESELIPEVSGRVVWMSPAMVSGGFFAQGQTLLRIDPLDYEVALEEARAGLARSESELAAASKEQVRQLDLSRRQVASDRRRDDAVNRFGVAEASLREANARLTRATRDLARTRIVAPYAGRVRTEQVDVGQFVNRGAALATIYAVDFAEVRLPVPDEELAFLDLPMQNNPAQASPAVVILRARFAGSEHTWRGEIARTEGELDPKTRMVNVVARVADPYAQTEGRPPLAVGLFVEAEILGPQAEDVVVLPRSALRGEGRVLLVDSEDHLRFRDVEVLRIARDEVYISGGLEPGERVCISPLESASDGMGVRVVESEATPRSLVEAASNPGPST